MPELKIHPTAARFPQLSDEETDGLAQDIKVNGLHQPIVLTADGKTLVDGINRRRACEKAGVKPKVRNLPKSYTEADIIHFIMGANLRRRDLNPGQKAALALDCAADLEAAAKERQRAAGGDTKSLKARAKSKDRSGPRGRKRSGQVRDQLAASAKVGKTTITKAKSVKDASPTLHAQVQAGTMTLNDAHKQVQRAKKAALEKETKPAALSKTHVTLKTHLGENVLYQLPKGEAKFNATNDQVSWAGWTWNPVTGCLHNCPYCYAREGAVTNKNLRQFYPAGFTPLFHHERLSAPFNMKVPPEAAQDSRMGRVFVSSMGDLFGKWVPDEWIEKVFASCHANQQWEYLFLTKFPQRYVGLQLPPTAWIGTTVDEQYRVKIAEEAFRHIDGVRLKWLSLEPLREDLRFNDLSMFDFVVLGSQSATEQPEIGWVPEFAPPAEWVMRITDQAHEAGCRVYWKPNLNGIPNPQCAGMKLIQEEPKLRPVAKAQGDLGFGEAAE